jgi:quinol monooxygenase YgiN
VILVIGSVIAQSNRFEEALRLSQEHVARSRAESGCISHAVHIDAENRNRLVFVERWADQTALAEHFRVQASRDFVRAMTGLAAEPPSMSIYAAAELQR